MLKSKKLCPATGFAASSIFKTNSKSADHGPLCHPFCHPSLSLSPIFLHSHPITLPLSYFFHYQCAAFFRIRFWESKSFYINETILSKTAKNMYAIDFTYSEIIYI